MNGVASDRMVRSTPSRCHPLDLLVHLEERRVEPEMHAADVEIDRVAFAPLDLDGEFIRATGEAKEFFRHEMAVDIGNHRQSPR